jgi:hypothetical protein
VAARLTHTTDTVASAVPGPAGLDLAVGVNMALAAEYRTCSVLTMDHRDYCALRPLPRIRPSGCSPTTGNQPPGQTGATVTDERDVLLHDDRQAVHGIAAELSARYRHAAD